jgi:hypothetical protein
MAAAARILSVKKQRGMPLSLQVLDAPSGEWTWMQSCLSHFDGMLTDDATVHYHGVDTSEEAVRVAEGKRSKTDVGKHIQVSAFTKADLTKFGELRAAGSMFDIVLCNDALRHKTMIEMFGIIRNFNKLGSYLIVDIDTAHDNQKEYFEKVMPKGVVRPIDLTEAPFRYEPICVEEDKFVNRESREGGGLSYGVFKLPLEV